MSTNIILKLTRRNAVLADTTHAWRGLVEEQNDTELLSTIKECVDRELVNIGYYAICLNRFKFLQRWWNNDKLPQIKTYSDWVDTLLSLQLVRLHHVKCDIFKLLLAIFKSHPLRQSYPTILTWEKDHPGELLDYSDLDNLDGAIQLRLLLVEMATAMPNGTHLLYGEWKKYDYDHGRVWNFPIPYRHSIRSDDSPATENELSVDYNVIRHDNAYTPLLQACRYGNKKDLVIFIHHPDWWLNNHELPTINSIKTFPLVMLTMNKNLQTFRYMAQVLYMTIKVCTQNADVSYLIWENCWIRQVFGEKECTSAMRILASHPELNSRRKRIILLHWLCPEHCNVICIAEHFSRHQMRGNLIYSTYNYYNHKRPAHLNPEDLLWIETQKPLLTPKADGTYYVGFLPREAHPFEWVREKTQAEKVVLKDLILYMVFDRDYVGRWDDRITQAGERHEYWHGPYPTLKDENADLERFLEKALEQKRTVVWWPKGVYGGGNIVGTEFFQLLSNPPSTPYPNDGWVVAGNKGPFWKVKPSYQLTLDVMYNDGKWLLSRRFDKYMITEFPADFLPQNLPHVALRKHLEKLFKKDMDDIEKLSALNVILQLLALNPEFTIKNITFCKQVHDFSVVPGAEKILVKYQWLFQIPIIPPQEASEYSGTPIYDGVWRCIWDETEEKWRPHSRRYDKTTANADAIGDQLTQQHKHPWLPFDLIPFIQKRPYYSDQKGVKTSEIRVAFKKQREEIEKFKSDHISDSSDTINLGGGYQGKYWESYDIDPYIVAEQNWLCNKSVWADARTLKNPLTNQKYTMDHKAYSIQKSIHYLAQDREGWVAFLDTISGGSELFISMLDAEKLFSRTDTFRFPDGQSTMTRMKQGWHRGIWNCRSELQWRGSEPLYEPVLSYSFVKQELEEQGWKETANSITALGLRLMAWEK